MSSTATALKTDSRDLGSTDLAANVHKDVSTWHSAASKGGKLENPEFDTKLTEKLAQTIRDGAEALRRDEVIAEGSKAAVVAEAVSGAMEAIRTHEKLATYAGSKVKGLVNDVDAKLPEDLQLEARRNATATQAPPVPRESATARVTAAEPEMAGASR
ncbi:MAG TPA: hypothetical protein VFT64_09245 [Rickettsiales bacterium]|nr:hypothetical protein [Rickettsiales bacterium]